VRPALDHIDRLGVDFNLAYYRQGAPEKPSGHHFSWRVSAAGFQTFDRHVEDVNAMAAEVTLVGRYYRTSANSAPLPADLQVRFLDLLARGGAGGGLGLTSADSAELDRLTLHVNRNRTYLEYDVHYRFETTQDVTAKQSAFGARISAEIPLLHNLLDMIPRQTRRPGTGFRPKPVRAFVGIDYVGSTEETAVGAGTGTGHVWRAELQAAWSTHLMNEYVLRALWLGQYLFDAPAPVKAAGREFNAFGQVWLAYPLSGRTSLIIKYVSGRLPPNYDLASAGTMGLSISLQ